MPTRISVLAGTQATLNLYTGQSKTALARSCLDHSTCHSTELGSLCKLTGSGLANLCASSPGGVGDFGLWHVGRVVPQRAILVKGGAIAEIHPAQEQLTASQHHGFPLCKHLGKPVSDWKTQCGPMADGGSRNALCCWAFPLVNGRNRHSESFEIGGQGGDGFLPPYSSSTPGDPIVGLRRCQLACSKDGRDTAKHKA